MSLKTERDLSPKCRDFVNRAKAANQSKNNDYAISMMQAALKEEPLYLDGRRLLRTWEIQKYNSLSSVAKGMLNMKIASVAMKLSSVAKKEPAEQLAMAEEVLELDPYNSKGNTMIGDAGVTLGYPDFKAFAYETISAGDPKNKTTLNVLAKTYMDLREYEKAEKTFDRILAIDPRDGDALSGLKNAKAAHASKSGGWETEGGTYRDALKDVKESENLEQGSKIVKSHDAIEEQVQLIYKKWQAEPTNPVHSKAIAQLYRDKNDYATAVLWYQEAFKAGGNIDSSLEKIIGDLRLKAADQELRLLREALTQQTDPDAQAQYQAAIEQKEKELGEVRVSQAEARVRAYPNEGEYRFQLGEALFKIAQYKRATEELQLSLKTPVVRSQALNLMGLSFMKRNMLDFAIKQLTLAKSELLPMDEIKKEITYNLGLCYDAAKQPEKALDQYKEIYEHDMSYRDVAERVENSYNQGDQAA
jgi:tetratricopeptide (TPR) repeat protein